MGLEAISGIVVHPKSKWDGFLSTYSVLLLIKPPFIQIYLSPDLCMALVSLLQAYS